LATKIKGFNYAIAHLKSELSSVRGLSPGDLAPPIRANDIDGQPATITNVEGNSPSIIYIFTPSCAWCIRNLNNVRALFINTKKNYRFIGLSLSSVGLREYVSQYRIDFPVYSDPIGPSALAYKGGTPRTVVVSAEGRILKAWFGAYSEGIQEEVEEYFKTHLPGISRNEPRSSEKDDGACETCDESPKPQS
jgi:peroxiredoxin